MNAPVVLRVCPTCSGTHAGVTPCSSRHPPVRVTRLPRQDDAAVTEATARAWAEHDPTADRATEALDALRAAARALEARAEELVRAPGAGASLRLQLAEEAVLRAADTLRSACGVQP